jgi:DsbC/DsbD-like thiol-disulfide interchange protein
VQNGSPYPKRFHRPPAIKPVIGFYLCLLVAGCTNPQPPSNPDPKAGVTSAGVVKATPLETNITSGESAEAVVRLKIDHGYHINANPPSFSYLIPTQLELTPAAGISVESITYPNALTRKFSFSEQPLAVYEGEAEVKVRLNAEKSAAAGVHNLSAKLRVQACDDQVCYAPGSIDLTIPVSIK